MTVHKILVKLKMRDLALATVLLMSIAAFAVVTPAFAVHPEQILSEHGHQHTSLFKAGTEYRIQGSGTAFNVTDKDDHQSATLDLTVKVDKANFGRARLTVEKGGMLTIGSSSFTVESGHGLINTHSMKIVIHLRVDDGKGHVMHLILFGHATKLNSDGSATIDFMMPQSKLAGKWFLEFKSATMKKV